MSLCYQKFSSNIKVGWISPLIKIAQYSTRKNSGSNMDLSAIRTAYNSRDNILLENKIEIKEPYNLFQKWFSLVKNDPNIVEPNAMCLSTATKDGRPSARFVLCKGYDKNGFKFFTHYTSRKGQELEENPFAALTFYWQNYNRSVRIEGSVVKLPFSDADTYFNSRPYDSRIGTLCSNQSKQIEGRQVIEQNEKKLKSLCTDNNVPRPPQWGGYLLAPTSIEFWQGQTDRLHDRIRFRKPLNGEVADGKLTHQGEDGWIYERLAP